MAKQTTKHRVKDAQAVLECFKPCLEVFKGTIGAAIGVKLEGFASAIDQALSELVSEKALTHSRLCACMSARVTVVDPSRMRARHLCIDTHRLCSSLCLSRVQLEQLCHATYTISRGHQLATSSVARWLQASDVVSSAISHAIVCRCHISSGVAIFADMRGW